MAPDATDPIQLITSDHRQVEALFDQVESAEGDERSPLVERLVRELTVHMRIEEEHLYPIVQRELGAEMLVEANTEHDLARDGLDKLCSLAPDEPGFGA